MKPFNRLYSGYDLEKRRCYIKLENIIDKAKDIPLIILIQVT